MPDKGKQPRFSEKEKGAAAVGATALGAKYAGGAVVLRRLKNAEKAAQTLGNIGRKAKSASGPDAGAFLHNPSDLAFPLKAQAHQAKNAFKRTVNPNLTERKVAAGAAHWEKAPGHAFHQKATSDKPGLTRLHPRYADHKAFRAAVDNAPDGAPTLHRAIRVTPDEAKKFVPGSVHGGGRTESWTDSEQMAGLHSALNPQKFMRKSTKQFGDRKNADHEVFLHHAAGGRALNIQGMGGMSQREWVKSGKYKVDRTETKGGQTHVYVSGVSKMMSDAEIRRRKKLQGKISQTTATLGLAALGARGGASAAKRVGRFTHLEGKLKNASTTLTTVGAGVGGAGGYNFAAYTNAESKKRKPVAKMWEPGYELPSYGNITGLNYEKPEEVSKFGDWKTIDQRERTQRRDRKAMRQAGAVGAAGAGLMAAAERRAPGVLRSAASTDRDFYRMHRSTMGSTPLKSAARVAGGAFRESSTSWKMAHGGAGLVAAGAAVGAGAAAHHKYNQTKINARRKANYKKKVSKAYDPERNRQRRMDLYSAGAQTAAGAAGAGSFIKLKQAAGTKVNLPGGKVGYNGLRSKSLPAFKGGLKNAGKGAALAGAAAGASVVSHKIRNRNQAPRNSLRTPSY